MYFLENFFFLSISGEEGLQSEVDVCFDSPPATCYRPDFHVNRPQEVPWISETSCLRNKTNMLRLGE